jgi:hypothetical protein
MKTAYSTKPLAEAVAELQTALQASRPRAVLFFASARYDPAALSQAMQSAFPDACVAGCSTAGEISGGVMLTESVTAIALGADLIRDAAAVVVQDLAKGVEISAALASLEEHFHVGQAAWELEKYVGLVLVDGLSGAEERLMEKLGDSTDIFFVGGSAGDDLKFTKTHVCAHGEAFTDSAVLVLLRVERGYEIVKTQSFRPVGRSLVATAVDEAKRTVIEFNHQPALDAYAEALGIAPGEAVSQFFTHPLGLMVEGEPFVRSPQRAEGSRIVFYCQIRQGMELEVLEATDIIADTRRAVRAVSGEIRGLIDFQCILRTLQLRGEKRCQQYGEIFSGIPMAGFSTYGEAYLGHLNQTSTILVFH